MNKKKFFLITFLCVCILMCFNTTFATIYEDRITNASIRSGFKSKLNDMQRYLKKANINIAVNQQIEGINISYDSNKDGQFGDWVEKKLNECNFSDEGKINNYFNGIIKIVNSYLDPNKEAIEAGRSNLYFKIKSDEQYITNNIYNGGDKTSEKKITENTLSLLKALTEEISGNPVCGLTDAAIAKNTKIELKADGTLKESLYDWTISQINDGKAFSTILYGFVVSVRNAYLDASNEQKKEYPKSAITNAGVVGSKKWVQAANDIINQVKIEIGKTGDTGYVEFSTSEDSVGALKEPIKHVTKTILLILQVASVAGIMLNGIIYMFSSSDAKAEIKKKCINLVIGLVIVFGASSIISIVTSIASDVMS